MDYKKLVEQNEQLKDCLGKLQTQFNDYIMREKEFKHLGQQLTFYKKEYEHYVAKSKTHEKTIEFLRQKLEKTERQMAAVKKSVGICYKPTGFD